MVTKTPEIPFSLPLRIVRSKWRQVILIALGIAILFAGVAWLQRSYVANATIRTPDLTLAEFKRVVETSTDPAIRARVAATRFQGETQTLEDRCASGRHGESGDAFTPLYTVSRADLRETSVAPPKDGQQIVAVQARGEARNRSDARQCALLLADVFADAALKSAIVEYVTDQQAKSDRAKRQLDAKIAADTASLDRILAKIRDLQRLRATYPEASRSDSRQVVSIAEGGDRYLSPVTQLVGAESEAVNVRDSLRQSERKHRQLAWLDTFFQQAGKTNYASLSGGDLLEAIEAILETQAAATSGPGDPVRESVENVRADLSLLRGRYIVGYTLLRAPVERPPRAGPPLLALAIGGTLASLLISVLLVLAVNWRWQPESDA